MQSEGIGDRRRDLRFEIIGDLWATVTTNQPVPLINLGSGGVLVELPTTPLVGSLVRLRLTVGDEVTHFSGVVRHVTPAPGRPNRYLVGMAVVDLSVDGQKQIDAFVRGSRATPAIPEA